MKHLLTAIACCLAVAGSAQTPVSYNPDSDGDYFVGAEDLLALLSEYGTSFTPLQYTSEAVVVPYTAGEYPPFYTEEYSTLYIIDTRLSEYTESEFWIYANVGFGTYDETAGEHVPHLNGTEFWFIIPSFHGLSIVMEVEYSEYNPTFQRRGRTGSWVTDWGTNDLSLIHI